MTRREWKRPPPPEALAGALQDRVPEVGPPPRLLLNWSGAIRLMEMTEGRPRQFSAFGLTTEIHTLRGLAVALFGWLS